MAPEGKERETAERIEAMAHVLFGLPRDERSRRAAEEVAGMLARIDAASIDKEEEPIMPAHRQEDGGTR